MLSERTRESPQSFEVVLIKKRERNKKKNIIHSKLSRSLVKSE